MSAWMIGGGLALLALANKKAASPTATVAAGASPQVNKYFSNTPAPLSPASALDIMQGGGETMTHSHLAGQPCRGCSGARALTGTLPVQMALAPLTPASGSPSPIYTPPPLPVSPVYSGGFSGFGGRGGSRTYQYY